MLDIRRYEELGTANHGWLEAHFHFSFAAYHDPERMGLGNLRVINDDIVHAGGGFGMHPHRDMEIITYVREGAITHEDSLGNKGATRAGDVQVMSAGTGIVHSEYNHEDGPTRMYQIWIYPRENGLQPRWEARKFPQQEGALKVLASGFAHHAGTDAALINQDAAIYGGTLSANQQVEQPIDTQQGYLLVSKGSVHIGDEGLYSGDGAAITELASLSLHAGENGAELVLIAA